MIVKKKEKEKKGLLARYILASAVKARQPLHAVPSGYPITDQNFQEQTEEEEEEEEKEEKVT